MIGTAHKGSACDFPETHFQGSLAERLEFFRRDKPLHGQMFSRGLEVLAQGEDAATGRKKIAQNLTNLTRLLAQAEHEAGLGGYGRVHLMRAPEHIDGSLVDGSWPH